MLSLLCTLLSLLGLTPGQVESLHSDFALSVHKPTTIKKKITEAVYSPLTEQYITPAVSIIIVL